MERWHQGKLVGYVITGVGVFGLLIAGINAVILDIYFPNPTSHRQYEAS
jgi:hypothetical protein